MNITQNEQTNTDINNTINDSMSTTHSIVSDHAATVVIPEPPSFQSDVELPLITFPRPPRVPKNFIPNSGYSQYEVAHMRGNMPYSHKKGVRAVKKEMFKTEMCRGLIEKGSCNVCIIIVLVDMSHVPTNILYVYNML